MPHSSRHNKVTTSNKLVNVLGDDGWSTVGRKTTHISQLKRVLEGPPAQLAERLTDEQLQVLAQHNGTKVKSRPSPPKPDYTVEQTAGYVSNKHRLWRSSDDAHTVKKLLSTSVADETLRRFRSAVCLGSGSLSVRHQGLKPQWQVAAFLSMAEIITETTGEKLSLYAQDPVYNDIDMAVLETFGVKVLEMPGANDLVREDAFIFAPHLPLASWSQDMRLGRAGLITGNDVARSIDLLASNYDLQAYFCKHIPDMTGELIPDLDVKAQFEDFVASHNALRFPTATEESKAALHDLAIYWKRSEGG